MKLLKSWGTKTDKKKYLKRLIEDKSMAPTAYDINKGHQVGEHISHTKFGLGFIEKYIDHNKILVFFEECEKVLMHNRENLKES